jgi:hypothetical protein
MSTRIEMLLGPVSRDARIIEIGPSFNPVAPKAAGWNSFSIDHTTREGLVKKYKGDGSVDVSKIEDVDFVWKGGSLSDCVATNLHGTFDIFIASHVIEHTPDLIVFLDAAEKLLSSDGTVALAVPDKRYCFDYFQPLTTTGQILEAHAARRSRHVAGSAFDYIANSVSNNGIVAWGQHPSNKIEYPEWANLSGAKDLFSSALSSPDYIDVHNWRFVPASFELLFLELARLGETDWRIDHITPPMGCEFITRLRRGGKAHATSLTEEELNRRRLGLQKRVLLETYTQIDWLLRGEPDLCAQLGETLISSPNPDIASLRNSLYVAEAERAAAEAGRVAAEQQVAALEASTSWRATAPLRAMSRMIRG